MCSITFLKPNLMLPKGGFHEEDRTDSSCWTEILPTTLQRPWRKIFPIKELQPSSSTTSVSLPTDMDGTSDAHFS